MSDVENGQVVTLLKCQNEGCDNTFEMDENPELPESARSLAAAMAAHKAGWYAAGGPILCPACAAKAKGDKPLH